MSSQPTHEATPDNHEQPTGHKDEKAAAPAKAARMGIMLKMVGRYALLGLTPLLAIAALAVALMAYKNNQSNVGQLTEIQTQLESLNTSLSTSKAEVEKLKFMAAKEKNAHSELLAKQEERVNKVVQNITPIQTKLKIRPTLEEQLNQGASAPVTAAPMTTPSAHESKPAAKTSAVEPTKIAPTPHVAEKHAASPAPTKPAPVKAAPLQAAPKPPIKVEAAPKVNPAATKPTPPPTSSSSEKTVTPQVKAMKEAIEQFNGKQR